MQSAKDTENKESIMTCKQCEYEKIKRENPGKLYDCWWRGHTCDKYKLVYREPKPDEMSAAMKNKYEKAVQMIEKSWLITKLSDTETDL